MNMMFFLFFFYRNIYNIYIFFDDRVDEVEAL